jgi:hypothetical protein
MAESYAGRHESGKEDVLNKAELAEIDRRILAARDARAAIDAIFDPDRGKLIAARWWRGKIAISGSGPSKPEDARLERGAIRTRGKRSTSPRRALRRSRPESHSRKP